MIEPMKTHPKEKITTGDNNTKSENHEGNKDPAQVTSTKIEQTNDTPQEEKRNDIQLKEKYEKLANHLKKNYGMTYSFLAI